MLEESIVEHDLISAQKAIDKGANVNLLNIKGRRLFPNATYQFLIDNNYSFNYKRNNFLYAVILKSSNMMEDLSDIIRITKLLVDNNVELHSHKGEPLIYALADRMADNQTAERISAIQYVIENGAAKDLNIKVSVKQRNGNIFQLKPIYHTFSLRGHIWLSPLFSIFVENGTAIDEPIGSDNLHIVHIAAYFNKTELLEELIAQKVDLNVIALGMSPLDMAKKQKNTAAEILLLENNAKYYKYAN